MSLYKKTKSQPTESTPLVPSMDIDDIKNIGGAWDWY